MGSGRLRWSHRAAVVRARRDALIGYVARLVEAEGKNTDAIIEQVVFDYHSMNSPAGKLARVWFYRDVFGAIDGPLGMDRAVGVSIGKADLAGRRAALKSQQDNCRPRNDKCLVNCFHRSFQFKSHSYLTWFD